MAGQGTAVNPLIEKFGPGPLSIFAVIRMPDGAMWRRYLEHSAEMDRVAKALAADYRVELGRCQCCNLPISEHVVGEANHGPASERRRWVICRECVREHGGRSLRTKLAYMDHTRNGGKR
jgi:hypothetical protein